MEYHVFYYYLFRLFMLRISHCHAFSFETEVNSCVIVIDIFCVSVPCMGDSFPLPHPLFSGSTCAFQSWLFGFQETVSQQDFLVHFAQIRFPHLSQFCLNQSKIKEKKKLQKPTQTYYLLNKCDALLNENRVQLSDCIKLRKRKALGLSHTLWKLAFEIWIIEVNCEWTLTSDPIISLSLSPKRENEQRVKTKGEESLATYTQKLCIVTKMVKRHNSKSLDFIFFSLIIS